MQLETEPPTCDGRDDDCDCAIDEGTEVGRSVEHCEACNTACPTREHTTISCVDAACAITTCADQWFNPDGLFDSGCRCNIAESPDVGRLTGGEAAPGEGYGAWFGDGTPGQIAWLEVTGDPRRLVATTRSVLGEGYPGSDQGGVLDRRKTTLKSKASGRWGPTPSPSCGGSPGSAGSTSWRRGPSPRC
ncbi:MAG: hypothetical protein R3F43_09750 [bacterium]